MTSEKVQIVLRSQKQIFAGRRGQRQGVVCELRQRHNGPNSNMCGNMLQPIMGNFGENTWYSLC